jgi:hypothetical protein
MKSFKDIRSKLTEEYYDGPTAYAAGDRTNVGDIAGTDLGSVQSGGANKPYPSSSNMDLMSKGLQAALGGVYEDVVDAVTRARAKFNAKTDVVFTFESSGTGYKINVNFA